MNILRPSRGPSEKRVLDLLSVEKVDMSQHARERREREGIGDGEVGCEEEGSSRLVDGFVEGESGSEDGVDVEAEERGRLSARGGGKRDPDEMTDWVKFELKRPAETAEGNERASQMLPK